MCLSFPFDRLYSYSLAESPHLDISSELFPIKILRNPRFPEFYWIQITWSRTFLLQTTHFKFNFLVRIAENVNLIVLNFITEKLQGLHLVNYWPHKRKMEIKFWIESVIIIIILLAKLTSYIKNILDTTLSNRLTNVHRCCNSRNQP